jgi:hypothetical protein
LFRHIAYVSISCSPLDAKFLADILEVSVRNNERDAIGGVLMYHDQIFFQIIEGDGRLVEQCYERICRDPRHSGISLSSDEAAEARSFPDWLMGYVGPDEISEHTGGAMLSLAGLNAPEISDGDKYGHALELARIMFKDFSKR